MKITNRTPREEQKTEERDSNETSTLGKSATNPSANTLKEINKQQQFDDQLANEFKRDGEYSIMLSSIHEYCKKEKVDLDKMIEYRLNEKKIYDESWARFAIETKLSEQRILIQQMNESQEKRIKSLQEELDKKNQYFKEIMNYFNAQLHKLSELRSQRAELFIDDVKTHINNLKISKINFNGLEYDFKKHLMSELQPTFSAFQKGEIKPEDFTSIVVNKMKEAEISYRTSLTGVTSDEKEQHLNKITLCMQGYKEEFASAISTNINLISIQKIDEMADVITREKDRMEKENVHDNEIFLSGKKEFGKSKANSPVIGDISHLKSREDLINRIEKTINIVNKTEMAIKKINVKKISLSELLAEKKLKNSTYSKKDGNSDTKISRPSL